MVEPGLADGIIGQIARTRCGEKLRAGLADKTSRFTLPDKIGKRFILMVLSERGYWGEELIGPIAPLDVFDTAGYSVDFCTPTRKRPNAIPVSMDPEFIDPPLGRSVTTEDVATKVAEIDSPTTPRGTRLEHPISLAEWLPERPFVSVPCYLRALEAYHRNLDKALERIQKYDALLIVGGSGPLMDLANNGRLHDLILAFVRAEEPIGAMCYGVGCLAFARD